MDAIASYPRNKLNQTVWRDKPARSCAIVRVASGPQRKGERSWLDIEVEYRSPSHASFTGSTMYRGWNAEVLLQAADGTLLAEDGSPLPDGSKPIHRAVAPYDDIDFNRLDFGELTAERQVPGIERVDAKAAQDLLFAESEDSGSLRFDAPFTVPHRYRPLVKIVISDSPSGVQHDGFGTRLLHLNNKTPHLEFVLMRQVTTLVGEFLEGKVTLPAFSSRSMTLINLGDLVVDCTPNQYGMKSWFGVMRHYVPGTFLEELACRVSTIYAVDASVVEGKTVGLLLKRS